MEDFLQQIRDDHSNFDKGELSGHVGNDPFSFFRQWYKEAFDSGQSAANAMSVSTVDKESRPSSRIVYLKELTDEGFVFFTNYNSQKGENIAHNPYACALFFWDALERQVRIEGKTIKVDAQVSDAYFASRPRASQLGAWASHQSEILESRSELEARITTLNQHFPEAVPRPPYWGGYVIIPEKIEFWQGRPSRLHDRIVFEKHDKEWLVFRKNP